MKNAVKRLVLCGVLLTISGCSTAKIETATSTSSKTVESTSSSKVEKKDINELMEAAGYTTNVNNGLRETNKMYYFLAIYIENIEEGYTVRGDVYHDGTVGTIRITDKRAEIDGVVYTSHGRYQNDQELIDTYLAVLKEIGIDKEEMMVYLIETAEENKPDEEWIRKNTDMLSSSDVSETQESKKSQGTSTSQATTSVQSDIKTKIKEIDAKYDEMIERIQGYIDDSASYDDAMALALSTDYLELLGKYSELTYETGADGDELTDNDTLAIFKTLVTKNLKLTELYTKLSS